MKHIFLYNWMKIGFKYSYLQTLSYERDIQLTKHKKNKEHRLLSVMTSNMQ